MHQYPNPQHFLKGTQNIFFMSMIAFNDTNYCWPILGFWLDLSLDMNLGLKANLTSLHGPRIN